MSVPPSPPATSEAAREIPGAAVVAAEERDGVWVNGAAPGWRHVARRILTSPIVLRDHWDMVWTSTRRELEARFTGTILGWFWPLIYPVFMFLVYYFIFTELLQMKFGDLPEALKSAMGVYMFIGIALWSGFAEPLARGTNVVVENGNLIKKLAFPTELLPLTVVLVGVVNIAFAMFAFVITAYLTPIWPAPGWRLLWILPIVPLQILFTYGLCLFLATCQVFLRDTAQVVGILITIWMFLTPIFWAPTLVPDIQDWMPLLEKNPTYHLVYVWRVALMSRLPDNVFTTPAIDSLITFAFWAVGTFIVGYVFFIIGQRRFADEI